MNLRDLKYLVALKDHAHFGKAAEHCFISQPALSMQIKKLEQSFGVTLAERSSKTVFLTPIGETITERARAILHQVEEMKTIAQQARDPFSGELTLGVFPTLAPYVLPHIVPSLSKLFPKLKLYLIEEQTERLIKKLKNGTLEAALLALPHAETDLTAFPIFEEEFVLALPHTHKLAKEQTIKPSDVKNKSLLLLEEGHCLRNQALEFCHTSMISEEKNFKATSLETLRYMVAANVGITLMPKLACRTHDVVSYVPFCSPKPKRIAGLVWRTSSTRTLLLESLVNHIKKIMSTHEAVRILD